MTRWEKWLKELVGNNRRAFICGKYKDCEDCLLYKPCMVDRTEDDYTRNPIEFEKAIDEWLDADIEDGIRYTASDSLLRNDKCLPPIPEEDKEG